MDRIGKIIGEGTTPKGSFLLRYPMPGDAPGMCDYINNLSREKTFILFQGEQLTLEQEEAHLARQLEDIARNQVVSVLAVAQDGIVGIASAGLKNRVESHVADFGISIALGWRGLGIGRALMQAVLDEAQAHFPSMEIMTLSVFGNNETAMRMYQRFGFREYGRLSRGILHRGEYVDHIYMYRELRARVAG